MSIKKLGDGLINIINGNVGIGITNPTSKLSIKGNVAISGTVSASSVVNSTANVNEPFTVSNVSGGKFLNWLISITTEAKQSWWATSSALQFSTIVASGTLVTNGFSASVLIPDGRVIFIPNNASTIGIFNPVTSTYTLGPSATGYSCGVLIPDGRVVCVPYTAANIGIYNPNTNTMELVTPGSSLPGGSESLQYNCGVSMPNGNVAFIPYLANNIGIFNPYTKVFSILTTNVPTGSKYHNGVLLPDGRIICVPSGATTIGIYTPSSNSSGTGTFTNTSLSATGYNGGVLLIDGRVLFVPYDATSVGFYTPDSDGVSQGTFAASTTIINSSGAKFIGGTLLQDGRVLFSNWGGTDLRLYDPATNTTTTSIAANFAKNSYTNGTLIPDGRVILPPGNIDGKIGIVSGLPKISIERCLHPCFNKSSANISDLGALDTISNGNTCVAAYALRRLFNSYTGPQIRIKRNATGTQETDVYYDRFGTVISVTGSTSLSTFAGGTTLYIVTWYDQSGMGNHGVGMANPILDYTTTPTKHSINLETNRYINIEATTDLMINAQTTPFWAYTAFKGNTLVFPNSIIYRGSGGGSAATDYRLWIDVPNTDWYWGTGDSANTNAWKAINGTIGKTSTCVMAGSHLPLVGANGTKNFYAYGPSGTSMTGTATTAGKYTGLASTVPLHIGDDGQGFNGVVYEVLIYRSDTTGTVHNSLISNLSTKYI